MKTTMDKLLPCPMCGKPAATDDAGVHCSDVGCGLHLVKDCTAEQWNTRHTPEGWAMVPTEATREQESKAEDYWQSKRFAAFSDDPRTWAGVYQTMLAAAPKWGGE